MTYREISLHLIDFIENYLTAEKIYKVSAFNRDMMELRKEIFEKSEENRILSEKLASLGAVQNSYNSLIHDYNTLKKESDENEETLNKIRIQILQGESPSLRDMKLSVNFKEKPHQKNDNKDYLGELNELKQRLYSEQKNSQNLLSQIKLLTEKLEQADLKIKVLQEKRTLIGDSSTFKSSEEHPRMTPKLNSHSRLAKIEYFSRSTHQ